MIILRDKYFGDVKFRDKDLKFRESRELKMNGIPTRGRPLRFMDPPISKKEEALKMSSPQQEEYLGEDEE